MLRLLAFLTLALVMTGCISSEQRMAQIFEALEFGEGQKGCVRVSGQVSLGGNPFANSNVNVTVVKSQGEGAETC